MDRFARDDYRGLAGTPTAVIERLETVEDLGAAMVMLRTEHHDPETVDALFEAVAPAVR